MVDLEMVGLGTGEVMADLETGEAVQEGETTGLILEEEGQERVVIAELSRALGEDERYMAKPRNFEGTKLTPNSGL